MVDELAELQKEFRQSVLESLKDVKDGLKAIERDVHDIRSRGIDPEIIKDMQKRIGSLEKAKTQLVTALVIIQTIFVAIWVVVSTAAPYAK